MSTEPDIARDAGPFNVNEALKALDLHKARAAKAGNYGLHADLVKIAELIEDLADKVELAARKAENLYAGVLETERVAKAAIESLSRLP